MKFGTRRTIGGAMTAAVWLLSVALVGGQAAPAQNAAQDQTLAENVFQNVTTLRGIPVDEFMGTMGVFSAALGFSCEDCHTASSDNWANYAQDTSPRKQIARQMVRMMTEINERNFGGRPGRDLLHVPSWRQPAEGHREPGRAVRCAAPRRARRARAAGYARRPTATEILDRYLQAVGGAQNAAALTSFVAKGTYSGYGPEGEPRPVEIYAKFPNQKTTVVRDPTSGDNTTTFSGTAAWHSAPFRPVDVLELHEAELESAAAEAELVFPANVTQALTGMRTSNDFINDRTVLIVQGIGAGPSSRCTSMRKRAC